jgi:hypothetical protein
VILSVFSVATPRFQVCTRQLATFKPQDAAFGFCSRKSLGMGVTFLSENLGKIWGKFEDDPKLDELSWEKMGIIQESWEIFQQQKW